MQKAIQAGATEINAAKDYEYGYRQGMFKDPFGQCVMVFLELSAQISFATDYTNFHGTA